MAFVLDQQYGRRDVTCKPAIVQYFSCLSDAGLAQWEERLTAKREVVGLIPGVGPVLRVLKSS